MELPCDPSDFCLVCRILPPDKEVIFCDSCDGHWHMKCLRQPLLDVPEGDWYCPECLQLPKGEIEKRKKRLESLGVGDHEEYLVRRIKQIQSHPHLNEKEKAKLFQELMQETRVTDAEEGAAGKAEPTLSLKVPQKQKGKSTDEKENTEFYEIFRSQLSCEICNKFPVFIVTTPCGHTFCGVCVQHLKTCTTCYSPLPMARTQACTDPNSYPRTNFVLECAIRLAKHGVVADPIQAGVSNDERPDKAFTTSNAKLPGLANACSGRIYATVPDHYLGPITAEYDVNKRGVRVGDTWENRLALRQSGAHRPHVTAFAGTVETGCPSIVLSKGYNFDIDNGDYFICTGCGGCDLSNNKRTGKLAFDQTFIRANQAMRESCMRGYPVRVIRSHKIMQSKFKPRNGLRYDGIYRIEMCWRFMLDEGIRVCRFLFVRCDNEPAIWKRTKDADKPRKLPVVEELKRATDITKRSATPHWDFQAGAWGWRMENPSFKSKPVPEIERFVLDKDMSLHRRILRDFQCGICAKEMLQPIAAPCGHMFCKQCLEGHFNKLMPFQNPNGVSTMHRRERKSVQRCPKCNATFADVIFEVNLQLKNVVEGLLQTKDKSEGPKRDPSPAEVLTGPEADVRETWQLNPVVAHSGQTSLGKRKVIEDKQQQKKGVRLNLIRALANPTLLSKKQTLRKRPGAGLQEESKGTTTIGTVPDIAAPGAERALISVVGVKDEHDKPSASVGQDEDLPGFTSDSAVRHYKRRKRELPLSGGSGSKRSCDLASASEGSDVQKAGSHSETENSSDHKRRKIVSDREENTLSMQEVDVEFAEKAEKASGVEEVVVENADKGDKGGSSPNPGKPEDLLKGDPDSGNLATSPNCASSKGGLGELDLTDGQVDKEPPASDVCTLQESPLCGSGNAKEDPNRNATEMCTVNVEVVEHPKGLHGAIEVGVCPADELPRPDEVPHHDNKGIPQVHLATAGERDGLAGSGGSCFQTPADKFCAQIRSLARQEVPKEQNWGFLARCMRDFRQSWSNGRMGRLAQNLAPNIRK